MDADTPAHEPAAQAADSADAASAGSTEIAIGLPAHAAGLLKIRVPVQVMLASQRKSIREITELGPGAIIKFEKTCDAPLELLVGDRSFAHGEVVKIGDKFGLRLTGLV